jgi:hypothetical protein
VFTNVNPHGQNRVWHIGEPFAAVAAKFLPELRRSWFGRGKLLSLLGITRGFATEYDYTMLQLHNLMKGDLHYQKNANQREVQFAPGSTWLVCTDQVSHAVLSGQYMFEQTFYLPVNAMDNPQHSPLNILEKMTGRVLV